MDKLKLIKLDIIHPIEYLEKKKKEWGDLDRLSLEEYRQRLIDLRSNYSDFYTYYLNQTGEWDAEEFFLMDEVFLEKVARRLFGLKTSYLKLRYGYSKRHLKYNARQWRNYVLTRYIKQKKFDVIFARSQPFYSRFFRRFDKDALLVARLSARLPNMWHPGDWDIIYTDHPVFKKFFEIHGTQSILNKQGFDSRITEEVIDRKPRYDVTFVGGLGTKNFTKRTDFINRLAQELPDFKWWGYWWASRKDQRSYKDFEGLKNNFQGITSGMEMFQVFRDSKIVLNDYVDTADGYGFNQRIFEAMGCGAFMLTRYAENFKDTFPDDVFVTYRSLEEAKEKIDYYLERPEQRKAIAERAAAFVRENYSYREIGKSFGEDLKKALKARENQM